MDPASAHLGEDVVHKDQDIGRLVEKEELPCVWLELWIEGNPYGLDELARLDGDTGAYCEPSEDIACRTAVTLQQERVRSMVVGSRAHKADQQQLTNTSCPRRGARIDVQ